MKLVNDELVIFVPTKAKQQKNERMEERPIATGNLLFAITGRSLQNPQTIRLLRIGENKNWANKQDNKKNKYIWEKKWLKRLDAAAAQVQESSMFVMDR